VLGGDAETSQKRSVTGGTVVLANKRELGPRKQLSDWSARQTTWPPSACNSTRGAMSVVFFRPLLRDADCVNGGLKCFYADRLGGESRLKATRERVATAPFLAIAARSNPPRGPSWT
jgi:hypothetical protein